MKTNTIFSDNRVILTHEILEKNGFYYGYTSSEEDCANIGGVSTNFEKGWCWDDGAGEIKVIFPNNKDGGCVYADDQSFDREVYFGFSEIIYVNDLQNILNLCNIEKTIEL